MSLANTKCQKKIIILKICEICGHKFKKSEFEIHNKLCSSATIIQVYYKKYIIKSKFNIIEHYKKEIEIKLKKIYKKSNNEFCYESTIFGLDNSEIKKQLKIAFNIRQIQMKEGDVAQTVLGNFIDWEDLGNGHSSGLDIRKKDNSAIIELKNKYNTCNSGSTKAILDKLAKYKKQYPYTRCIWGIINPKNINKKNTTQIIHEGVILEKLEGNELMDYIFTYNNYNYKLEILEFIKKLIHNLNL
jgi:hypothetical protein